MYKQFHQVMWNLGFLSNREGKTSSTSGIDTEVLPKTRDEEHRFNLLRLRYYGSATQKQVTNTEIPCFLSIFYVNNDHFLHNHRNGCKKWHFKNSKSNVKLFGKFSNRDILIFSNHPQSKFVHGHVQL